MSGDAQKPAIPADDQQIAEPATYITGALVRFTPDGMVRLSLAEGPHVRGVFIMREDAFRLVASMATELVERIDSARRNQTEGAFYGTRQ